MQALATDSFRASHLAMRAPSRAQDAGIRWASGSRRQQVWSSRSPRPTVTRDIRRCGCCVSYTIVAGIGGQHGRGKHVKDESENAGRDVEWETSFRCPAREDRGMDRPGPTGQIPIAVISVRAMARRNLTRCRHWSPLTWTISTSTYSNFNDAASTKMALRIHAPTFCVSALCPTTLSPPSRIARR